MRGNGERGVLVHSQPGGASMERLSTSPHYCLLEHTPGREEERKKEGVSFGGRKVQGE